MDAMTEERRMLQQTAREFAMREVLPEANRLDPVRGDIPDSIRRKLGELGFFGIMIPEEYGGLGLGAFEYCLVTEELARAWMSVGTIIRNGLVNTLIPLSAFNEDQRRKYCHRMAAGEFLGAFSMSEPGAGSDVASLSCQARRDGDDWLITGNKYWCTFADAADFIVVVARTSPMDKRRRHAGISAFILEKERGSFPPGLSGQPIPKIGYFGWKTYELAFDGVRVPAANMLGEEGRAFYMVSSGLEVARVQTAARAIGVARGALEDATEYAKQRVQFGEPIGNFQAIRFKLAQMATDIEAARQLMYFVCQEIDRGRRCDKEAAMAKLYASDMSEKVTSEAIQIHGGAGYTTLFAVERYWRDARLTRIFEGTSEIQLRIISDHILGKPARPNGSGG